jgi:type IV pilus assembly protein PilN
MYTLDINFLSDRVAAEQASAAAERQPIADTQFLIYGGAIAVVALSLVGGAYLFLSTINSGVRQEISTLTSKESELKSRISSLKGQEEQLKAIEDRTNGLVNLFVRNLPMSAIADDIRKRTPITVQVDSMSQAAATDGKTTISLVGKATSYTELNDFMLLLKASPLLDDLGTKLISSTLQAATVDRNFNLVNFQIQTTLSAKPITEILPALQKAGADGLVARVNRLKEKGVIK